MRQLIAITLAAACVLTAGCNTMSGMGQDIQWMGQELQEAAE